MSNLVDHAKAELERAGVEEDVRPSLVQAVKAFASYGHSGGSHAVCVNILGKLLRFEPLTPLTGEADEWNDVSDTGGREGGPVFQNKRYSSVFMEDGEAYDIGAVVAVDPSGGTWGGLRKKISFPYTPQHEEVHMDAHGRGPDGEEIMSGFCDDDGCNCWRGGEKLQLEGDVS